MPDKPKPASQDDPAQSKRFIDMAQEVKADESCADFERAVITVGRSEQAKPQPTSGRRHKT